MGLGTRLAAAAVIASAIVLAAPFISAANDADTREISSYVLTEGGLAKFTQATQNLAAVPGACTEQDDDGAHSQSVDQMVANLNAVPGAQAAIQSAGMTTREYVVFAVALPLEPPKLTSYGLSVNGMLGSADPGSPYRSQVISPSLKLALVLIGTSAMISNAPVTVTAALPAM